MDSMTQTTTHRTLNGHTVAWAPTHNGLPTPWAPAPLPQPAAPVAMPVALPEAACSVNLFFEVSAGYGKAQATGRGSNAQEAVTNLKATIDATRAALAPAVTAPLSREAHVAKLLSCGLAKAVGKSDWPLVEKLAKASALVLSGAVEACAVEGTFTVRSRTQEGVYYHVSAAGTCDCKDYEHRATPEQPYRCLHILAVLFEVRLAETKAPF